MSFRKNIKAALVRFGYRLHGGPCERTYVTATGELLAHVQPSAILDVGGCQGEYGFLCRNLGYSGTIHSFEPMPQNFAQLSARTSADPVWHAHPYALGDVDASAVLHQHSGDTCHSLHPLTEYGTAQWGGIAVEGAVDVSVRRLDAVWSEIEPGARVWLKSDTEGHDLAVLAGAGDRIEAVQVIQIEMAVHPLFDGAPTFLEITNRLEALGFEPWAFDVVNHDDRLRVMAFDGLFVRH